MGNITNISVLLENGEIYIAHTNKQHPLGTRGYTRDGRVFRYALAGAAALTPGQVCQGEAVDSAYVAQEMADSTDWAVPTTATNKFYLSTDTSLTTASFIDGYYMVTAGGTTYGAQCLQIKDHTVDNAAAGSSGCPVITTYDEDNLVYALSTAYTISLIQNPYHKVIAGKSADAAITAPPVGVCPTSVALGKYFWLQTWGMACVKASGTLDTGHMAFYDSTTGCSYSGMVKAPTTASYATGCIPVGVAQYIGTDGYAAGVMLTLAP